MNRRVPGAVYSIFNRLRSHPQAQHVIKMLKYSRFSIFSKTQYTTPLAAASFRVHLAPTFHNSAATTSQARPVPFSSLSKHASPVDESDLDRPETVRLGEPRLKEAEQSSRQEPQQDRLTHIDPTGAAHMVDVAHKQVTSRSARAACTIYFSDATAPRLIRENSIKKGDVLGVARIAGIMAAKRTPDLIPLCHPLMLSHISIELVPGFDQVVVDDDGDGSQNRIDITAHVCCDGKTGVEMEALTAASTAALTVYDMCKAVDKGMRIEELRLISKEGGKSGPWGEAVQKKR